jgi:hypothetical protein
MISAFTKVAWQKLAPGLEELHRTWPNRGWSWDGRLNCLASTFSMVHLTEARAAAARALPVEWTGSTIASAPPRVQNLSRQYGDIRSGQLFLTGGPVEGLFAFGLWWPWNNGLTISLRVGLVDIEAMEEPYPMFREMFGATLG